MRLNLSVEQTIRGGAKPIQSNVHKTTINNTIFRIVTKGLYIRPIEAIVREICTNALDGHIAAGIPEVPFDITLPNTITPYFIVRDYGISMDNDTVFNVYAVLGESTKNATSNSIGGWGVGGKSPAAYTDTFFITTYKDGIRRIYQSSCLQNSTPLELLLEGFTDEKDGVEVKIPIKSEDFQRFIRAAETQLAPFDVKPNIMSNLVSTSEFSYDYDITTAETFNITPSIFLPNDKGELVKSNIEVPVYLDCTENILAIRMGCVLYPINTTSEFFEQYSKRLQVIKTISGFDKFLVDLPVDTVDIKPSREDLDYTERTNMVLNTVMLSLYKHYLKQAITIAYQARVLPTVEAIDFIIKSSPTTDMTQYIMSKYSTKPDFSQERMKYINVPYEFNKCFKQAIKDYNKDRPMYYEFSVCDGEKTKKYENSGVKFWFTKERTITLIKRSKGYIKKLNYWFDEGKLTESGLINKNRLKLDYRHFNSVKSYFYIGNFIPESLSPYYIVVNDDELTAIKPLLEKFFNQINVIELAELPKQIQARNRNLNQSRSTRYVDIRVYTSKGDVVVRSKDTYLTIAAIKGICEDITQTYQEETVFTTNSDTRYDRELLLELCSYHKINVVSFDLPNAFKTRIYSSKNVKFLTTETIMNKMKANIPDSLNTQLRQEYITRLKYVYLGDTFSYSAKCKNMLRIPSIKDYFFKFAPKKVEKPEYPTIASYLVSEKECEYLAIEAETASIRVLKRYEFLLKIRPTLTLVDNYARDSLIVELFKLNFKGFNPDANQ